MLYKVIMKNFKSNLKNYILFFVSNIIAVAELFAFWGINDIVNKAITDTATAESLKYDFWIAAGLVTFITMFLMIFSMKYYVRMRVRDYSTFIMLGMRKRMSYLLMLAEYSMGWFCSFLIGLLLGHGVLYAVQKALYQLYPEFIRISSAGFLIYRNTFLLSAGIMAVVFIGLLTWMENKDLGSLMLKEETKEKKPVSPLWLLFTLAGIGLVAIAVDLFQGTDLEYLWSHIVWVMGSFLILAFGCAVSLEFLKRRRGFYMRRVLKLNQLYGKYQSNLMVIFILFVIHFFALTYITIEIAGELPLEKYRENYPYDMIWMAQQKDEEFSVRLIDKYDGIVRTIPMLRVTTQFGAEHIGISESSYEELSGKQYSLKDNEILVGIEEQEFHGETKIQDESYWNAYGWLYIGRFSDEISRLDKSERNVENRFEIQEIFTQSIIGQYSVDQWKENVIVFSDAYFTKQWEDISRNEEEACLLQLYNFPSDVREKAWKELDGYAAEYGTQDLNPLTMQGNLYDTEQFLIAQKMQQLFSLSSKLFILLSLFISGIFVMGIKTLSEMPVYFRRYDFLNCMGMCEKDQKRTLGFEVRSIFNIALGAGLVMGLVYALAYLQLCKNQGVILDSGFWKYWGMIIALYIAAEYIVGRLFARYVNQKVWKEKSV